MYRPTVQTLAEAGAAKRDYMKQHKLGYFISTLLAGAYVGLGIILIFSIGAPLAQAGSPYQSLVMGASFGIALTLVIIAGAELFTGNNMVFTISTLSRKTTLKDTGTNWLIVFIGNLLGAIMLAYLIRQTGLFNSITADHLIFTAAAKKMTLPFSDLFFRGILCNWLVCLAVWMSMRLKSEGAKMFAIWWCLFAFIGSGYEHSVANMTLLSVAMFLPNHPEVIDLAGWLHNMIPVTLGNMVGGILFVGMAYWRISPVKQVEELNRH
ncbi:formate/nitrite transporter family protein [Paenibacillus camelliae]|uniref:formate/nitrite transporter family protein n=1 Tax=Paenibacillus camelliae TaxID=512410 RepID=UPI00203DD34C|nr:formate/nitrite transporter family protein [Paenibacillus camelliae]MCM3633883.1 formate/nitrite transporter family protein [Paenibacillus camelliae]